MAQRTWEVWDKNIKLAMKGTGSCRETILNVVCMKKWFEERDVAEFLCILWGAAESKK